MRPEHGGIDGGYADDEVAVFDFAGGEAVVLAAAVVPEEVAEVHVAYLIAEEIAYILPPGGTQLGLAGAAAVGQKAPYGFAK